MQFRVRFCLIIMHNNCCRSSAMKATLFQNRFALAFPWLSGGISRLFYLCILFRKCIVLLSLCLIRHTTERSTFNKQSLNVTLLVISVEQGRRQAVIQASYPSYPSGRKSGELELLKWQVNANMNDFIGNIKVHKTKCYGLLVVP